MASKTTSIEQAARQVVTAWRKRLRPHARMFSDAQQKAFVAEEVLSVVLAYADAEKVKEEPVVSASDVAAIYRAALKSLGLD